MQGNRISADELKRAATGRWLDILSSAGLPVELLDGRGHGCPKCGGKDRFAAWPDVANRGAVHCRRCFAAGMNPAPTDGLATLQWLLAGTFPDACRWLADWLGMEAKPYRPRPIVRTVSVTDKPEETPEYIGRIAQQSHESMKPDWWDRLSDHLSLPVPALKRLHVGWSRAYESWTFPMRDASGAIIGVRTRRPDGTKKAVAGSRAGIFIPDGITPKRLFIAEGPTDTAALLSLGLDANGRPSCTGCKPMVIEYAKQHRPTETIIMADGDEAGILGAESLASELVAVCTTKVMVPPAKDCREWFINGCGADDILTAAGAVDARTLSISSEVLR